MSPRRKVEITERRYPAPGDTRSIFDRMGDGFPPPPPPSPETDAHDCPIFTPCRTCGGATSPVGARYVGGWREHAGCAALVGFEPSRIVAAVHEHGLGALSESDAALLAVSVPMYATTHPEPVWARGERSTAWSHVEGRALKRALASLPSLRDRPTTCTDGPCAWCGVAEAMGWASHGHRWADGSEAPLCGVCSAVYLRHGSPSPNYFDEQREALSEAVTRVPQMMGYGVPDGLRAFAETSGDEPTGQPWSHLDPTALESYRWEVWSRFDGAYAPVQHREEAQRRARERDAVMAERTAEHEAEQAQRADVFGFGASQAAEGC